MTPDICMIDEDCLSNCIQSYHDGLIDEVLVLVQRGRRYAKILIQGLTLQVKTNDGIVGFYGLGDLDIVVKHYNNLAEQIFEKEQPQCE